MTRLLPLLLLVSCASTHRRYEQVDLLMGTKARVVVYAADEVRALEAMQAALKRIAELDSIFSDYRPETELMRLCDGAGGPARPVSPDLFRVLDRSLEIARASDGAFDVTVGPYVRLWRRARREGKLPDAAALDAARPLVGWRKVELDRERRAVRLAEPGMRLDLGGIGKGYACDQALSVLERSGVPSALVDIGGDIAVGAAPPGRKGWRVAFAGSTRLLVRQAMAASGATERFFEVDGVRYSHIVDPRTGLGVTHGLRVAVIAANGTEADALASAVSVLGREQGAALAAARGAEAVFSGSRP